VIAFCASLDDEFLIIEIEREPTVARNGVLIDR
jgi:hypothetical protein